MVAVLSGTCKQMIKLAAEHAISRNQFDRKIKDFGTIQKKFAQMSARTYASESLAYLISSNMDRGSQDYQLEAAIGKIFASETAWYVTDEVRTAAAVPRARHPSLGAPAHAARAGHPSHGRPRLHEGVPLRALPA